MNFLDVVLRKDGDVYSIDAKTFKMDIPAEKAASIKNIGKYVDKEVILGIRPEDIEDAAIVGEDPRFVKMEADVDVTEPMGAEVYVYFSSGDNTFIARLDATTTAKDGMKHNVGFNMHKIHLFDKDTEEVIR